MTFGSREVLEFKQNCHPACPGVPWDRSDAKWRDLLLSHPLRRFPPVTFSLRQVISLETRNKTRQYPPGERLSLAAQSWVRGAVSPGTQVPKSKPGALGFIASGEAKAVGEISHTIQCARNS